MFISPYDKLNNHHSLWICPNCKNRGFIYEGNMNPHEVYTSNQRCWFEGIPQYYCESCGTVVNKQPYVNEQFNQETHKNYKSNTSTDIKNLFYISRKRKILKSF